MLVQLHRKMPESRATQNQSDPLSGALGRASFVNTRGLALVS